MPEGHTGHGLSLRVTASAFAALEVDQVGLLVAEEVDKPPTLHFRERDLDGCPGQVAEVGGGGRLLDLFLDGVPARVGVGVLLFSRLGNGHRAQKRVNKKIKNHPFEVSGPDYFSPRHHHRHRGNKKSFIKFVSSTDRIIYFSSQCRVSFLLRSFSLFHHHPVLRPLLMRNRCETCPPPILSSLREIYGCHKNVSTEHFHEMLLLSSPKPRRWIP